MAVPVRQEAPSPSASRRGFFHQQMVVELLGTGSLNYDVSPDGRFVMLIPTGRNHELEFVLNWD